MKQTIKGYLIYNEKTKTYFGMFNTGSQVAKHLKDYCYSSKGSCERAIKYKCNNAPYCKVYELKG